MKRLLLFVCVVLALLVGASTAGACSTSTTCVQAVEGTSANNADVWGAKENICVGAMALTGASTDFVNDNLLVYMDPHTAKFIEVGINLYGNGAKQPYWYVAWNAPGTGYFEATFNGANGTYYLPYTFGTVHSASILRGGSNPNGTNTWNIYIDGNQVASTEQYSADLAYTLHTGAEYSSTSTYENGAEWGLQYRWNGAWVNNWKDSAQSDTSGSVRAKGSYSTGVEHTVGFTPWPTCDL